MTHKPMLFLPLAFAVMLAVAQTARATTPIPPPPCPDIGSQFLSLTSLVDIIATQTNGYARQCGAERLATFGAAAMPRWIALMNHQDLPLRRIAITRILDPQGAQAPFAGRTPPLEQSGLPKSAMPHYLVLAAALEFEKCSGGQAHLDDAGLAALPALIDLLKHESPLTSRAASSCLGELGPQAAQAAPHMLARIAGLADRRAAIGDLARVGVYDGAQFDQLLSVLPPQEWAQWAQFSSLPATIVPLLAAHADAARRALGKRNFHAVHRWLALALSRTGSARAAAILIEDKAYVDVRQVGSAAVPLLIDRLAQARHLDEQVDIAAALAAIGSDEALQAAQRQVRRMLPRLIADLKRPGAALALERLRRLGPLARPAAPAMMRMLDSPGAALQSRAATALGHVHAFDAEAKLMQLRKLDAASLALQRLRAAPGYWDALSDARLTEIALVNDGVPNRWSGPAIAALARRGPAAIPALLQVMDVWNERFKISLSSYDAFAPVALSAIAAMGSDANPAFAQLVRYLNDRQLGYMLGHDKFFLARMGMRTEEGMRLLFQQVVDNSNADGRWHSAVVLGEMGAIPAAWMAPLRAALARPELWTHDEGRAPDALLFAVTGQHVPARPIIRSPIADPLQAFVRAGRCLDGWPYGAAAACTQLKQEAGAGVALMLPMLGHADSKIRQGASDYLGSLGATASAALPHLALLLRDPVPLVRRVAADNLCRIGGHDDNDPRLLAYLLQALGGPDDDERYAALAQLLHFTRLPEASLPALQQALADPRLADFHDSLLRLVALTNSAHGAAVLIARLEAAYSQAARDMAVAALVAVGPAATAALLAHADAAIQIDLRIAYAAALAAQQDSAARTRSGAMLERLLPEVRAELVLRDHARQRTAARRLGVLMAWSAEARQLGMDALPGAEPPVRATLLAAIGEHGELALLPALVQAGATEAAARIRARHPSVLERWQRCVDGKHGDAQAMARCRGI